MDHKTPLDVIPQISEINMTPLMDLSFILLITFIITFPLIEQGIPINLPRGEATELQQDRSRTVSMDLEGGIYLDEKAINPVQLATEMKALAKTDPDITVYIRADEGIKYGKVVDLLEIMHKAKISRIALVTQADQETGRP